MAVQENFPIHLKNELILRRRRNPGYSLRAFAKNLGVSSSFLSKVMSGKKSVSEATFLKMANRLELELDTIERYRAKLPGFKPPRLSFDSIENDAFQTISDWEHFAILEALTLDGAEPTVQWLASVLEISNERARHAVERLCRLGYLRVKASGKISGTGVNLTTANHPTPSSACREHERQILERATLALDKIPTRFRDQTSMTLAIPSSRLGEARDAIDRFRQEMASILQRRGKRDSVYHLSISLYPVTKLKNLKNKE